MRRILEGKPLQPFTYKDFGSLVSFGEYSTVGNLMGFLVGRNLFIEGYFARLMYRSLHLMHEVALYGSWRASLRALARKLAKPSEPTVKLH
jgi:NADH dehydrogenase